MQADLICGQCPLADCDEESLWCMYRLVSGKPNQAQARFFTLPPKPRKKRFDRRAYGRIYREENREAKREYDRKRHRQKVLEQQ